MNARLLIGTIKPHGAFWQAECAQCTWKLNKLRKDEAESLLKSHDRISHENIINIYRHERITAQ